MNQTYCGIVGFGFSFPDSKRSYKDIAELSGIPAEVVRDKFGINQLYYPGNNEQTTELAISAAQDCLKNTGIAPEEIDLIIYFGENYADHIIYPLAAKVQGAIGAVNAWGYNIDSKCGTAVIAMDQALKYMQTDADIKTVMIVGGYRNVDKIDYTDHALSFMFDLSCGGAACILKKGYEKHCFLGASALMDGSFADTIKIPVGGTKTPYTQENLADPYGNYFRLEDPEAFRNRLGKITLHNLVEVQKRALQKNGLDLKDLDFVCVLHMNKKSHKAFLEMLGVPLEKSVYLEDFGHVGQLDPLISLNLASRRGLLHDGDIVGVIAMGIGYAWNGGVIRW